MTETRTRRTTARSAKLFEEAAQHLAGGVGSGTRSPRSGWLPLPIFVEHAQGAHLTDVDGNLYIDYAMGLGPLTLGHRPPAVIEAVTRQITDRGLSSCGSSAIVERFHWPTANRDNGRICGDRRSDVGFSRPRLIDWRVRFP